MKTENQSKDTAAMSGVDSSDLLARPPTGTIVLTVTPDNNVDYDTMRVRDVSQVFERRYMRGDPLPVIKDGVRFVYDPSDIDINSHRLLIGEVPYRILHRLSIG